MEGGTTSAHISGGGETEHVSYPSLVPVISTGRRQNTGETEHVSYPRRWYILLLFSLLGFVQNVQYNAFSPFPKLLLDEWQIDEKELTYLTNWFNVAFVFSLFPFVYLVETKGLRLPVALGAAITTTAAALRTLHISDGADRYLFHFSSFLNGLGGPISLFGCTLLSVSWFPSNQRATATAVSSMSGNWGIAFSFVMHPIFVNRYSEQILGFRNLLVIYEVIAAGVFLLIALYYPSQPPSPPSRGAQRRGSSDFWSGVRALLRSKQGWYAGLFYGVYSGCFSIWNSLLAVALTNVPLISDSDCGWLAFIAIVIATALASASGFVTDRFPSRLKPLLCCVYMPSLVVFAALAAVVQWANTWVWLLWLLVILGTVLIQVSLPVAFELSCEILYPLPESLVTGWLCILNNILSSVLSVALALTNPAAFLNWVMWGSLLLCAPLLLLITPDYRRQKAEAEADSVGINT